MTPMRYFLSGASGIRPHLVGEVASYIEYRLLSMHKAFNGNTKIWCAVSNDPKSGMKEVMLDSGAFTAFMKGEKLTVPDLAKVYRETMRKLNKSLQVWLINLDVIPGSAADLQGGKAASPDEIKAALKQSDENYKKLRAEFGDIVLPVYHQTEGEKRLRQVVAMNHYVAMGFRQDFAETHRIKHAATALSIAHASGVKVHGLATTGTKMLLRAPFDSVDSASWLYAAAMGKILFVAENKTVKVLPISQESPFQKQDRGHFNTLPDEEKEYIAARVAESGSTMEQVQSDLSYRILVNAQQMKKWMDAHYAVPKTNPEVSLFPL